jgi:hypothetical protein
MSLKRTVLVLLVLLALGVGVVKSQPQADQRNFWALNNTHKEIREFYVSSHDSTRWGGDILGRATLADGMGTVVYFDSKIQTGCNFDFKIVFADGSAQQYLQGKDVCKIFGIQYNETESIGLVRE